MKKNQPYLVTNPGMPPLHNLKLYTESVNEYICPICRGGKFTSKLLLKKHLMYHRTKYPVICGKCGIFLPQEDKAVIEHVLSHFPDDKFVCCICDSVFTNEEFTWKHLKNVHDINVEAFYHNRNVDKVSESQNHSNIDDSLVTRANNPCSSNEGVQTLKPCDLDERNCVDMNVVQNRLYSNDDGKHNQADEGKLALWHHLNFFSMTDNDRHKCPLCKDVFIYCELTPHILQHEINDSISCPSCSLTFSDKLQFVRHFLTHLRRRPFKCLKCNMTFRTQHNVIDHLINAHLIYYKCPICKLDFTNLIEAKEHFRISHNSELKSRFLGSQMSLLENPFKDSFDVEKDFDAEVFSEEGKKHRLVIADHRKYFSFDDSYTHQCPICDVKCTFSTLQPHIMDHKFGEALFCIKCKRGFSDQCRLIRHLLSHIKYYPFSCLKCKKKFKRHDLILKHLIENHGINYRCSVCEMEWRTLTSANKHACSHDTQAAESDIYKQKTPWYVLPDAEVQGEICSSSKAQEILARDGKILEMNHSMQTEASILKDATVVHTVSNIQNTMGVIQPDRDKYAIHIKQEHLDIQELDIIPNMDHAEVVTLEEMITKDPASAACMDVSRKTVTNLGSSPVSTDQNADLVQPVVIPHRWILDGNDEQYNLALQYEKSVIHDWMSMNVVYLS